MCLSRAQAAEARGKAEVAALEWGGNNYMAAVQTLATKQFDLVIASDCTYIDPDGHTPDDDHFMNACAGLCHAQTRCLITFEDRGRMLRESFLAAAHARFSIVQQVPRSCLPEGYQLEHIDLWELRL